MAASGGQLCVRLSGSRDPHATRCLRDHGRNDGPDDGYTVLLLGL